MKPGTLEACVPRRFSLFQCVAQRDRLLSAPEFDISQKGTEHTIDAEQSSARMNKPDRSS
jgi:hypothetical protein